MKQRISVKILCATFAGICLVAMLAAGVNGVFNSVNATTGYKVNGTAGSSGQALCSDGTYFDTPCSTAGTGITALTGPVTASGTGSVASTITATGVTAGSYTLTNLTVNAAGQITSAASGSASGITALTGPVTASGTGSVASTITPTGVTAGNYTLSSVTVNAAGQITSAASGNAFSGTSRKNCMSVTCAGGSTYVSGTTYTNALSVPVFEEVGMTTSAGSCTGADSQITYTVAGSAQGGNGVWNQCNGVAHVSFIVPPGATFSTTITLIDGGASPSLTSWFETAL